MNRENRILKLAQVADSLGNPVFTGKAVAEIIRFLLRKIEYSKRPNAIMQLKKKITYLNEYDMASKKSPETASLGQSITFIKTLLNGRQPSYIRSVLSEIARHL